MSLYRFEVTLPKLGEEEIDMLDFLDLIDKGLYTGHELRRCMIMKNVHVDSLITTGKESGLVIICRYASTNAGQDKSARIDRFEVASRHLQNNGVSGWHCGH